MTTLVERIKGELEEAVRQTDAERRSVLRMLLSSVHNAEISQQKQLDDAGIAEVIAREAKKRRESIEAFEQGNRPDLAAKEKSELDILSAYLPEQMSSDDITKVVRQVIDELEATGPGDRGKVMSKVMPQVKGKADGNKVSSIVTELLNSL